MVSIDLSTVQQFRCDLPNKETVIIFDGVGAQGQLVFKVNNLSKHSPSKLKVKKSNGDF